jgi:hypothetical protein
VTGPKAAVKRKARSGPAKLKPGDGLPQPPPVRPLEWMTLVRDHPDRPPQVQRLVLDQLALRLDWDEHGKHVPGHGFASVAQLAQDANCHPSTVTLATGWARGHDLLIRLTRGHHIRGGTVTMSEWRLRRPPQLSPTATLADDAQLSPTATLADDAQLSPTATLADDAQLSPTATLADDLPRNPGGPTSGQEIHNQDLITDNGPLAGDRADPRAILAALGVHDAAAEGIIARLAEDGIDDPAACITGMATLGGDELRGWLDRMQPPAPADPAPTAQAILAAFIDWDRARGGQLTKRTTGQLAKHIAALLAEGVGEAPIKRGLIDWRDRGQHPSTLHSFVDAAMNSRGPARSRREDERQARYARQLERARAADAAEANRRGELT